jgi:hypothetical protein
MVKKKKKEKESGEPKRLWARKGTPWASQGKHLELPESAGM